jgi:hypothetical protein
MTEHTTEIKGALWAEAQAKVATDATNATGDWRKIVYAAMLLHFLALVREG